MFRLKPMSLGLLAQRTEPAMRCINRDRYLKSFLSARSRYNLGGHSTPISTLFQTTFQVLACTHRHYARLLIRRLWPDLLQP